MDKRAIWPLLAVTGGDKGASGIVTRQIPDEFFHGQKKLREVQYLYNADDDARDRCLPVADMTTRLFICARIAAAYMLLHKLDVVIGDVSARNVVFGTGAEPRVLVVDTDSARKKGSRNRDPRVACQVLSERLDRDAAELLTRSLEGKPQIRPTMRDWYQAFGRRKPSPRRGAGVIRIGTPAFGDGRAAGQRETPRATAITTAAGPHCP